MKYLSFFSGVGCFECALHQKFPRAECIGFSEIDPFAIQVYRHHFPTHTNLGDITKITETDICELLRTRTCDLVVGGFPCQDLSSMANFQGAEGLRGKRSGLFYIFLRILGWIFKYNPQIPRIIIENNASMSLENKDEITQLLRRHLDPLVRVFQLDGTSVGMLQLRRRLFWTNFSVPEPQQPRRRQVWKDVLIPEEKSLDLFVTDRRVAGFNTLYRSSKTSDQPVIARKQANGWFSFTRGREKGWFSRWSYCGHFADTADSHVPTIIRGMTQFLLVRNPSQPSQFRPRHFHPLELERLFGLSDGYVSDLCSRSRTKLLLGNAIIVPVITHILLGLRAN